MSKRKSKTIKLPTKRFERSAYWNENKTKRYNKNTANEYRYFLKQNFIQVNRLFVLVDTNHENNAKIF